MKGRHRKEQNQRPQHGVLIKITSLRIFVTVKYRRLEQLRCIPTLTHSLKKWCVGGSISLDRDAFRNSRRGIFPIANDKWVDVVSRKTRTCAGNVVDVDHIRDSGFPLTNDWLRSHGIRAASYHTNSEMIWDIKYSGDVPRNAWHWKVETWNHIFLLRSQCGFCCILTSFSLSCWWRDYSVLCRSSCRSLPIKKKVASEHQSLFFSACTPANISSCGLREP